MPEISGEEKNRELAELLSLCWRYLGVVSRGESDVLRLSDNDAIVTMLSDRNGLIKRQTKTFFVLDIRFDIFSLSQPLSTFKQFTQPPRI